VPHFAHQVLVDFSARLLVATGIRSGDTSVGASLLGKADLRGYPAHGIAHPPGYLDRVREGLLDPAAMPEVVRDGPIHALVDGKFPFG
jgi:LDH2 family malate/lactate/ureidoglycolate dehydrogenase